MENKAEKIKILITLMGFPEADVIVDEEHRRISLVIGDTVAEDNVGIILPALDHILGLAFRKENEVPFVIDLNYYRKERERLIAELARAAAHKAMITKADVELPPMNAYERRLVHVEITTHPELTTESVGAGKERRVVIKRLEL